MFQILVCSDITAVIGARPNGKSFEGVVNVLQGAQSYRQQVVWPMLRATEHQALADARKAAKKLVSMWRDQIPLPMNRGG